MGKGLNKKQLREKSKRFYTDLMPKKRKEVKPYVEEEFKMKPKEGKA